MDRKDWTPEELRLRAELCRRLASSTIVPGLEAELLAQAKEYEAQVELAQNVELLRKMAGHGG